MNRKELNELKDMIIQMVQDNYNNDYEEKVLHEIRKVIRSDNPEGIKIVRAIVDAYYTAIDEITADLEEQEKAIKETEKTLMGIL